MNEFEILSLLGLGLALCLLEWRIGFLMCVVIGFLQDPIRKTIPEEPIYFTVLVGVFVAVTVVGASVRGIPLGFGAINKWNPVLRLPLRLFIGLVAFQSAVTLAKSGSFILAGIGLLAYLTPLPAILLGYYFCRTEADITNVLKVYIVVSVLMISGVYLSYLGFKWDILHSVGEGLTVYTAAGELTLFSGFMRSPEIAAWHAGTSVCMVILISLVTKRQAALTSIAGLLILFFLGGILLTGRRKFLAEIFLFISFYGILLTWFRKGIGRHAFLLMGGLAVAFLIYLYFSPDEFRAGFSSYYERGATVQDDSAGRAYGMTIEAFGWVIEQNGILGAGAGMGSQGAQYFGGGATEIGYAAEGGLAKVLAELGVPGLILLFWLLTSIGRYLWSIMMHVNELDPLLAKLTYGLITFLIANVLVYFIAHQVFGDPFVLVMIGFLLGFLLAMPKMQEKLKAEPLKLAVEAPAPITNFGYR